MAHWKFREPDPARAVPRYKAWNAHMKPETNFARNRPPLPKKRSSVISAAVEWSHRARRPQVTLPKVSILEKDLP